MEQLFGATVAQEGMKFTLVQCPKESVYIPSMTLVHIHSSPLGVCDGGNIMPDYDDVMSDNDHFYDNKTNIDWQEVWNDSTSLPFPSPSPQSIEHGVKGSKKSYENDS